MPVKNGYFLTNKLNRGEDVSYKRFTYSLTRRIFTIVRSKNKNMINKTPHTQSFIDRLRSTPILVISSIMIICAAFFIGPIIVHAASCSSAADCQAQINNLSNQNAQAQQSVSSLESQAQNYQEAINSLGSQISSLQQEISSNEAKQDSLNTQIASNQAELVQQKAILANDIETMYVSGQLTPVEMLATSDNLSDFIDQQVAYNDVQQKIQGTVDQINTLQQSLQNQKIQVDQLVSTEQTQNSQLSYVESQQQQLLGYNQSQQAAYNQQISNDNADVSQLTAQLIALNNAGNTTESSLCGGGYPTSTKSSITGVDWGCDLPQDNTEDNWAMLNRECVSYTAYMTATKYDVSTLNWGDAYQWIASAENAGYSVDQTPSAGSIAIRNRDYSQPGDVGHAMYVVSVNGSDSITVEEYNEHYNGTFDERTFAPSSYDDRGGLYFIHFQ